MLPLGVTQMATTCTLTMEAINSWMGQMNRGNKTETLWEGNLPPRESLRGRVFRGFERLLEFWQRFLQVLSETLSEADFPLRGSQSCCPKSCCVVDGWKCVSSASWDNCDPIQIWCVNYQRVAFQLRLFIKHNFSNWSLMDQILVG